MPLFGPPDIGKLRVARDFEGLAKALRNSRAETRCEAALALGELGGEQSAAALLRALGDKDGDVRWCAVEALGAIGDSRAIGPLAELLDDGDVRVRRVAAEALRALGWVPGTHPRAATYWVLIEDPAGAAALGKDAVAVLIALAHGQDITAHRPALLALEQIGDPWAAPPLAEALQDTEWQVRAAAARALVRLAGVEQAPALVRALGDRNPVVRREAARATAGLSGKPIETALRARAIESLRRLLADAPDVRRAAAAALRAFEGIGTAGDQGPGSEAAY